MDAIPEDTASQDQVVTSEQALFIEAEVNTLFQYTIESFDRARAEGNNVLQWLFGTIAGGLGLVGALVSTNYLCLGIGALSASVGAAFAAAHLVEALKSQLLMPPGHLSESLKPLLDEPMARMRWRAARGMDERITTNINHVENLSTAVDVARSSFAKLPIWFVVAAVLAFAVDYFFAKR